jgi:hypothetical protein
LAILIITTFRDVDVRRVSRRARSFIRLTLPVAEVGTCSRHSVANVGGIFHLPQLHAVERCRDKSSFLKHNDAKKTRTRSRER